MDVISEEEEFDLAASIAERASLRETLAYLTVANEELKREESISPEERMASANARLRRMIRNIKDQEKREAFLTEHLGSEQTSRNISAQLYGDELVSLNAETEIVQRQVEALKTKMQSGMADLIQLRNDTSRCKAKLQASTREQRAELDGAIRDVAGLVRQLKRVPRSERVHQTEELREVQRRSGELHGALEELGALQVQLKFAGARTALAKQRRRSGIDGSELVQLQDSIRRVCAETEAARERAQAEQGEIRQAAAEKRAQAVADVYAESASERSLLEERCARYSRRVAEVTRQLARADAQRQQSRHVLTRMRAEVTQLRAASAVAAARHGVAVKALEGRAARQRKRGLAAFESEEAEVVAAVNKQLEAQYGAMLAEAEGEAERQIAGAQAQLGERTRHIKESMMARYQKQFQPLLVESSAAAQESARVTEALRRKLAALAHSVAGLEAEVEAEKAAAAARGRGSHGSGHSARALGTSAEHQQLEAARGKLRELWRYMHTDAEDIKSFIGSVEHKVVMEGEGARILQLYMNMESMMAAELSAGGSGGLLAMSGGDAGQRRRRTRKFTSVTTNE